MWFSGIAGPTQETSSGKSLKPASVVMCRWESTYACSFQLMRAGANEFKGNPSTQFWSLSLLCEAGSAGSRKQSSRQSRKPICDRYLCVPGWTYIVAFCCHQAGARYPGEIAKTEFIIQFDSHRVGACIIYFVALGQCKRFLCSCILICSSFEHVLCLCVCQFR